MSARSRRQGPPQPRALPPTPRPGTFLEHVEGDLRGLAHDVRRVLDVAGEGAVVAVVQVVDDDGAVLPAGVPHPLNALLERSHLIDVRLSLGVVEDLGWVDKGGRVGRVSLAGAGWGTHTMAPGSGSVQVQGLARVG